jgi:hypothetical protein
MACMSPHPVYNLSVTYSSWQLVERICISLGIQELLCLYVLTNQASVVFLIILFLTILKCHTNIKNYIYLLRVYSYRILQKIVNISTNCFSYFKISMMNTQSYPFFLFKFLDKFIMNLGRDVFLLVMLKNITSKYMTSPLRTLLDSTPHLKYYNKSVVFKVIRVG